MLFETSKADLETALKRIAKIVQANPRSVPILQCVRVLCVSGNLYVGAFSQKVSAQVHVPNAEVKKPGEVVVDYGKFKDRLAKVSPHVEVSTTSTTMRLTSSEDQRLGIPLSDLREYPELEFVDPDESYAVDITDFASVLETALKSGGTDSLIPSLLQVQIKDKLVQVGNGIMAQLIPFECHENIDVTIPKWTINSILDFLNSSPYEKVWLSQDENNYLSFSVGADSFQAVPLATEFPDMSNIFRTARINNVYEFSTDRKTLMNSVRKAQSSTGSNGVFELDLSGNVVGKLKIHAESEEGDWYDETINGIWTGPDKKMNFIAADFIRFFSTFEGETLLIKVGDDNMGNLSPIYIEEGEHVGVLNQFRV